MDCNYETNKFVMPLLHIVGVKNCSRQFSFAFCFLSHEQKDNYAWALTQIQEILEDQEPGVIVTEKEQELISSI